MGNLLILSKLHLLTIDRKLPVINLFGISLGWSQLNLRLALVDGNMLKSIDFLGQDSMLVILGAVRSDQVITLINLVAVGLLVKSLDISLSNNTLGVVGFSIKSFVGVLNWVLSSNKWKNILHGCRNTDVSEDNIVLWRLDLEGEVFSLWSKLSLTWTLFCWMVGSVTSLRYWKRTALVAVLRVLAH